LTKNKKKNSYNVFKMDWNGDAPRLLHNDLEDAACDICPDIRRAKEALISHGASGALMTGSGSSVFGLFATRRRQRSICDPYPQSEPTVFNGMIAGGAETVTRLKRVSADYDGNGF
jgi:4-diphosphocytidyl-2C-methyl-D-erythritol kinase